MAEIVAPRPASTILLLRDSARRKEKPKEVFMMVRHCEIDFNSGALVFPGGSVDKGDKEIIANPPLYSGGEGLDEATLSFRIAAIRETFEESGILLARPKGSKALVDAKTASAIEAAHRADLCDGKITFLKVLDDNGMLLALDELVPYAHWITPEGMPKRFDTWFFLAAAPPEKACAHDSKQGDPPPTHDLGLAARGAWKAATSGRFKLPFPTTRNLIKLGKQDNVKAALDDSRGKSVVTVMPVMTKLNGGRQLRIPLEAGYDGDVFEVGALGRSGLIHTSTCGRSYINSSPCRVSPRACGAAPIRNIPTSPPSSCCWWRWRRCGARPTPSSGSAWRRSRRSP